MDVAYETDLALWAESQARALRDASRAGTNLPIDWQNVAEEIESLGRSQGRELASRIAVILVHLMKLEASPADAPRAGWRETIAQQRGDIERLLLDSPSLRPSIPDVVDRELPGARRVAGLGLAHYGEHPRVDVRGLHYTAEQVVADWFPDAA
ncbi:MAG TPA: DUF29 domain-containing protein [Acetobacteraceae bacterium]|nr:DUF29 domain-containing protein [Acetobacteraceae bacterium]